MTLTDAILECRAALAPPDDALVTEKLLQAFHDFIEYVPKPYRAAEESTMTVPLYDILTNAGEAILNLVGPLFNKELVAKGYFPELRKQLLDNENAASGISHLDRVLGRKQIIGPDEYDASAEELVRIYLRYTPFYQFLHTQVPFQIPRKTFASHGIVCAPPNHGKSQLLASLISSHLADTRDPVGIFVLDPHGDLFENLRTRVDPARLITLDPDRFPPPLNFLDFGTSTEAQTLQTFSYLMSSLSGGLSDKQGAIVPYLLKLLRQIPNASLETLRIIVDEKVKRPEQSAFAQHIANLPIVDQGFFHNQFYTGRMQETKDAIGWKLYSALSSDAFRQMFSPETHKSPEGDLRAMLSPNSTPPQKLRNSFDADAAMRDRKVVLVKGARGSLGDEGMQVFLQFIVAQFFSAALRRERIAPNHRHLCILFADETHHIFNSQTANILTECRKYGLGFVAATQVVQQIPEDVKAAIYGATAIKIAGPVSHTDAMILAREMYTTGDFIRSMKAKEASHADWAFYVSGMTDKAVKVRVPYGTLEALPKYPQKVGRDPPLSQSLPQAHEAPEKGASHGAVSVLPAEADIPIVPQSPDDPSKPAKGRP